MAHLSYAGALRPDIEGDGGSCSNLHPRLLCQGGAFCPQRPADG